jgi:hypothetical protein
MTGTTIRIVLLALVFLAWAWILFRAVTSEGGFGQWFRGAQTKRDRNTFLFLTLVLAVMVATEVALPAG